MQPPSYDGGAARKQRGCIWRSHHTLPLATTVDERDHQRVTYLQESRYEFLANGRLDGAKVVFCSGNDEANVLPLGLEAQDQPCICHLRKPRCDASQDLYPCYLLCFCQGGLSYKGWELAANHHLCKEPSPWSKCSNSPHCGGENRLVPGESAIMH